AAPHDMTAMRGMNMGGDVSVSSKLAVTFITLAMLAGGGFVAARYGDGMDMNQMPMDDMPMNDMKNR
ncbi:MAG: hypothetical protein H0U87_00460, partial [Acidobacteria bacterium]|nr:hypothetical protein [Acidobacteriota bacterium]